MARFYGGPPGLWDGIRSGLRQGFMALVFAASTRTSTIPGVSVAGPTPQATLYTPTLDVEYLVLGRPVTLDVVPVTPEGMPTPAIISRAAAVELKPPLIIVDAGCYAEPRVPHARLPGRVVGGRIDVEDALPPGRARELFEEARLLARTLAPAARVFVVGETMPGGTTTAMAIMEALGVRAVGRVSSSSPSNPHKLKEEVLRRAVERSGLRLPVEDPWRAVEVFGDPLHVSLAGFAAGAAEEDRYVLLAGGTQMCAVAALLKALGVLRVDRVAIATTRWVVEDPSSDMLGLARDIHPELGVGVAELSFADAAHPGLRAYEEGYVKEGVGAGGFALVYALLKGGERGVVEAVYREYSRLVGHGRGEED